MPYKMKYLMFSVRALLAIFVTPFMVSAQVSFSIPPDSIIDYAQYDRIETCNALFQRMSKQLASRLDSTDFRTVIYISAPVDTTPLLIRRSVGKCIDKFGIDAIATHDSITRGKSIIDEALRAYYIGERYERFWSLLDSLTDRIKLDSGYMAYMEKIESVTMAISSIKPVNHTLIDSIHNKYLIPRLLEYKSDLNAYARYWRILFERLDRVYKDSISAGERKYEDLIERIYAEFPDTLIKSQAPGIGGIRWVLRALHDRLAHYAILDSLRIAGPDGYFSVLYSNSKKSGYDTTYRNDFYYGEDKQMFLPLGFIGYRYNGSLWTSDNTEDGVTNREYPLFESSEPHLVMAFDHLCKREFSQNTLRVTSASVSECWSGVEYIKWFTKTYPEVRVTIITDTDGHYGNMVVADPRVESNLIRDFLWEFHKLPVDIVVYYTGSFTMSGVDQRRVDLTNDNKSRYADLVNSPVPFMQPTLISSNGRIVRSFPYGLVSGGISFGAVKNTEEFMNPFMEWYKNNQSKYADDNRHRIK